MSFDKYMNTAIDGVYTVGLVIGWVLCIPILVLAFPLFLVGTVVNWVHDHDK